MKVFSKKYDLFEMFKKYFLNLKQKNIQKGNYTNSLTDYIFIF